VQVHRLFVEQGAGCLLALSEAVVQSRYGSVKESLIKSDLSSSAGGNP